MTLFTGQKLQDWRVWGFWFKHRWFVGVSKVDKEIPS